jgi:hypothetical protein
LFASIAVAMQEIPVAVSLVARCSPLIEFWVVRFWPASQLELEESAKSDGAHFGSEERTKRNVAAKNKTE